MKNLREISGASKCPCGSRKRYKSCCSRKGIVWERDENGDVYHSVPMDPRVVDALRSERERFIDLVGREPEGNDRVLIDSYLEEAQDAFEEAMVLMEKKGVRPEFVYAARKTGRIVSTENAHLIPDVDLDEWHRAVDEYRSGVRRETSELAVAMARLDKVTVSARVVLAITLESPLSSPDEEVSWASAFLHLYARFCMARACKTLAAIAKLLDEHHGEDALSCARAIFEAYLRLTYVALDPENAKRFHAAHIGVHSGTHSHPTARDGRVIWKRLVNAETGEAFDAPPSLRRMAELSPFSADLEVYESIYDLLSSFSHTDPRILPSYHDGLEFTPRTRTMRFEARFLTAFCVVLLVHFVSTACFRVGRPNGDLVRLRTCLVDALSCTLPVARDLLPGGVADAVEARLIAIPASELPSA